MKTLSQFLIIIITICFFACSSKQTEETLFTIENIVDEYPDSALGLVRELKTKHLSKYEKAKVAMYEVIAKDKLEENISESMEIFDAAKIILKKGSDVEKAKVLLYASRVSKEN